MIAPSNPRRPPAPLFALLTLLLAALPFSAAVAQDAPVSVTQLRQAEADLPDGDGDR